MKQMSGSTQLAGIIGWPVSQSKSPEMHNAAAADLDLDLAYVPLAVRSNQVEDALSGLIALGFIGANVTVPHKEAVVSHMDRLEPASATIGAVNTIVISRDANGDDSEGVLSGYNTDWSGFMLDLEQEEWNPSGKHCLLLGAGGSARAIAYGLINARAHVTVVSRRVEQGRELVQDLRQGTGAKKLTYRDYQNIAAICQESVPDLIVNATPVGMIPDIHRSPWPVEVPLPETAYIYDLVYEPAETSLMKEAKLAGCKVSNGLGMLVQQGALAFELWTGMKPNTQIMATVLG